MKPKHFVLLLIAAVVSGGLAIATYASHNQWSQGRIAGAKLLPGLAGQGQRIAAVEISQAGTTLTLEHKGGAWSLKERSGYAALPEKVRPLLLALAEAELVEAKTRNPERYALLELEDPAGKGAKSRRVRVLDDKGGTLAEAVIGKRRLDAFGSAKGGTYVRKPGDAQTWLADREIDPSLNVREWVKATLYDVPLSKIKQVTVEIPGEEPLKIERGSGTDAKLAFAGLPEGRKLKDRGAAESIARAAASIDLDDVRKPASPPAGSEAGVVKVAMEDGLAVTVSLRKDGSDHWVTMAVTGEGEAKKTADEIAARTQGWEFKLPTFKADNLLKRRADLFEAS